MIIKFDDFLKNYENCNNFFVRQDKEFFYLWKKAGIASSFWKKESILDLIEKNILDANFCNYLKNIFFKNDEYWLLNRLDNDTIWFLYFAKNKEFYEKYKQEQKKWNITKYYYAIIDWDLPFENIEISYPIMHKNKTKMIAIKNEKDTKKWRWKKHFVKTYIEKIYFDKKENITYLKVSIQKWIRHQIRCHLASINYPIVWDKIYNWKKNNILKLYSVWFKLNFWLNHKL